MYIRCHVGFIRNVQVMAHIPTPSKRYNITATAQELRNLIKNK